MAKAKRNTKKRQKRDLPPADKWLPELKGLERPIYLLHGEEAMFTRQAAEWLKEKWLGHGIADFNLDQFDASESSFSVSALLNAINTQPMMSDRRVVRVQCTEVLNKMPKAKLVGLINYLANPSPQTVLILEARDRLEQTRALMKSLLKSDAVYIREAGPMTSSQTEKWLEEVAKSLGLKISRQLITLIQDSGNQRLGEMRDALHRLALFIAPRDQVMEEDLVMMLPEAKVQTTIWSLLDKLSLRQTSEVISLARALLESGQEVLGVMALVHRRLRELLAARSVMNLGGGEANLAQSLQMNGYAAKRVIQLAQNRTCLTVSQIASGFELLSWADRQLKGSKVDQSVLLEYVLIKLCNDP